MRTSQLPVSGQNPQLPNMEGEDGCPRQPEFCLGQISWTQTLTRCLAGAWWGLAHEGLSCSVCSQGAGSGLGIVCCSGHPFCPQAPEPQNSRGFSDVQGACFPFTGAAAGSWGVGGVVNVS